MSNKIASGCNFFKFFSHPLREKKRNKKGIQKYYRRSYKSFKHFLKDL